MSDDSFHNFHLDGASGPLRSGASAGVSLPSIAAACLDGLVGVGAASSLLLLVLTLSTGTWIRSWLPMVWFAAFLCLDFTLRFLAIRRAGRSAGELIVAFDPAWEGAAPAMAAFLGMVAVLPLRIAGLVGKGPVVSDENGVGR